MNAITKRSQKSLKKKIDKKSQIKSQKRKREDEVKSQEESDSEIEDAKSHKAALERLKEKDPEFYSFLQENEKELLNFEMSGSEEEADNLEQEMPNDENNEEELEGNEDNIIDDNSIPKKQKKALVTLFHIKKWKEQLQEEANIQTVKKVVAAFKSAVHHALGEDSGQTNFKVEGSTMFNQVVQLCITDLIPAVHKILKLPPPTISCSERNRIEPAKSKMWRKIMLSMKSYLTDMIKLIGVVGDPSVVSVLLKNIAYLVPYYLAFPKMSRILLKKIIHFWSTSEESVRILSFLSIFRIAQSMPSDHLDHLLKQMYMVYVKNSKFTSPSTWPMISFMKRSLVEMYALDETIAYQHSFVYIRQLAIHLRNAVTIKKKDSYQAVYNWQYIHCLFLWIHLISTHNSSKLLKSLIYPLTQIAIGTINLIPTAKHFPLRFHVIKSLIHLSSSTDTFIPVLPLMLQVLNIHDLNKKHTSLTMKPIDFSCILKVSKSQLLENGFKDSIITQFYDIVMEYLHNESHRISFPELVLPAIVQLKGFLKKSKVANYCRQIKHLLEKMEENANSIVELRKNVPFSVSDINAVNAWEKQLKVSGTPITKYYITWQKLKSTQSLLDTTSKLEANDDSTIVKKFAKNKKTVNQVEDQSSSQSSAEEEVNVNVNKNERKRKKKDVLKRKTKQLKNEISENFEVSISPSKKLKTGESEYDIIEDLNLDAFDIDNDEPDQDSDSFSESDESD